MPQLVLRSFYIFKKTTAKIQDLASFNSLQGNVEIKVSKVKGVCHPVNKIRLVVSDQSAVIRSDLFIACYIFIFDITRPCGCIMRISCNIRSISEYADLLITIEAANRLANHGDVG